MIMYGKNKDKNDEILINNDFPKDALETVKE